MDIRTAVPTWLKKATPLRLKNRLVKGSATRQLAETVKGLAAEVKGLEAEVKGLAAEVESLSRRSDDVTRQLAEAVKGLEAVAVLSKRSDDLEFLQTIAPNYVNELFPYLKIAHSQNRQDIFVLAELGLKRGGYFVEFGAAGGVELSNTHLLETSFGWEGILSEPAQSAHAGLRQHRKAIIDTRCVWKATGETLQFREAKVVEMSTIEAFRSDDGEYFLRDGRSYDVDTVSLNDLLAQHNAPAVIDFLSIDTEGSELQILSAFNFEARRFRTIVCEHNYHQQPRDDIYRLLTSKGYKRKFEQYSGWDDWYSSE